MRFAQFVFLFFTFLLANTSLSQNEYSIVFTNDGYKGFKRNPETKFKDSLSAISYIRKFKNSAIKDGFLAASCDKIVFDSSEISVDFFLGQKYEKLYLDIDEDVLDFLKANVNLREKSLQNNVFRKDEVAKILLLLQKSYLNNGYPFAKVSLTFGDVNPQQVKARLVIDSGPLMKFSKINVKGDQAVNEKYLQNVCQIKVGENFNEQKLILLSQRIAQVTFLKEIRPHEVLYTAEGVEVFIYIESFPISSINGVLGVQPKANIEEGYVLNGEVNLKLINTLKRGEKLDLKWRNIQDQTSQLDLQAGLPFLFSTPFGLEGKFNIYRRDSTFIELKSKISVQYFLQGGNSLSFFYDRYSSNLLRAASSGLNLGQLSNVETNSYGIGFFRSRLDYIPNPTRGILLETSFAVGQRTTQINDTTPSISALQYRFEGSLELYIPLAKRHVLKVSSRVNYLEAPILYSNELYRYGGLLTQRGFLEDQFRASGYALGSLEYRFLLDKNSRIFAFYDQSYYQNRSLDGFTDAPYGFGAGIAFGTDIGTFSILYALGTEQNNPIQLREGKVHFGYIAYF
jgi:outer membrane protein assembly factor BamA